MSRSQFAAQPLGVLDGRMYSSGYPSVQNRGAVYTHNPYWYEGFNPLALSGSSTPQYGFGFRNEEYAMRPWYWSRPRVPVRALRSSTLKYHLAELESQRRAGKPVTPQASDNSSDHTVGYSDSERSERDSDEKDALLEAQLVQCIVDYFGDCKGSLPSERVQNVIKKDYAELYEQVVVARFRKKWHKFLQHCSETFHLFTRPAQPAPNQDYCWRIRLVNNADWEEADQQEEELRARQDKELLDKVHAILSASPDKQCLMIDVINEMNKDSKGDDSGKEEAEESVEFHNRKSRKIRAGDLKRLMRKCNSNFTILEIQEGESLKRATYMKLIEPCDAVLQH